MKTPDEMMLKNGLKVEWLKKHEPDTYDSICKSMDDFAEQYAEWKIAKLSERKQSTKVSDNAETKALSIADVVRSYSKKDIISLLEDRKNHFKPKDYYKNERMRLTQAINTINGLVPDF